MGKLYDTYHVHLNAVANRNGAATNDEIKALFAAVDALIDKVDGPSSTALAEQIQKAFTQPKTPGSPHP